MCVPVPTPLHPLFPSSPPPCIPPSPQALAGARTTTIVEADAAVPGAVAVPLTQVSTSVVGAMLANLDADQLTPAEASYVVSSGSLEAVLATLSSGSDVEEVVDQQTVSRVRFCLSFMCPACCALTSVGRAPCWLCLCPPPSSAPAVGV